MRWIVLAIRFSDDETTWWVNEKKKFLNQRNIFFWTVGVDDDDATDDFDSFSSKRCGMSIEICIGINITLFHGSEEEAKKNAKENDIHA